MADSSLMDVQRAQLCVHNCRVPCTSCCWLLLTPLLTQPSSPQGLIYGPCFLPSSVLPSLPEAYVIQPEATEHSYCWSAAESPTLETIWNRDGHGRGTCDSCPQSSVPSGPTLTLSACLLPDQAICGKEGRPPTSWQELDTNTGASQ